MTSLATNVIAAAALNRPAIQGAISRATPPELDLLMLLGFLSSVAAIVCLIEHSRTGRATPSLAIFTGLTATLGFIHTGWPMGLLLVAFSIDAVYRWTTQGGSAQRGATLRQAARSRQLDLWRPESRITRMFGTVPTDYRN